MAYQFSYKSEQELPVLYSSLSFFWGHMTVNLHIPQVYWVTILATYSTLPHFIRAGANCSLQHKSTQKHHNYFFLLDRNKLCSWSWCATRLQQYIYKTVYIWHYVEEKCINFIVCMHNALLQLQICSLHFTWFIH